MIRSAVVEGVATATEVATIGVVYTVIVGVFFYRCFDWRRVYPILVDTASLSGAILLVVGAATAMAWALTQSGFSQQLVDLMVGVPGGRLGFLAISALAFVVLGSVLEGVPAIVLFGPLLFPVARRDGRQRGALRDRRGVFDGAWAVHTAVRRRFLPRLRDRTGFAR